MPEFSGGGLHSFESIYKNLEQVDSDGPHLSDDLEDDAGSTMHLEHFFIST